MKILVVEDEFTSRVLLQNLLARYGECHIAISGEEALEAYRLALAAAAPYDLICMDIRLPGIDGVEAARQIRALETADGVLSSHGTKILMQTSIDDVKVVVDSFYQLCDAYLIKPIGKASLEEKLRGLGLTR